MVWKIFVSYYLSDIYYLLGFVSLESGLLKHIAFTEENSGSKTSIKKGTVEICLLFWTSCFEKTPGNVLVTVNSWHEHITQL